MTEKRSAATSQILRHVARAREVLDRLERDGAYERGRARQPAGSEHCLEGRRRGDPQSARRVRADEVEVSQVGLLAWSSDLRTTRVLDHRAARLLGRRVNTHRPADDFAFFHDATPPFCC